MTYNLEKLIKTPIIPGGIPYLSPNGCGCAKGIAYAACHNVDWRFARSVSGYDLAKDNDNVNEWFHTLPSEEANILSQAESELFRLDYLKQCFDNGGGYAYNLGLKLESPEAVKKWMIDQLVALGVTDATPAKEVNVYE